MTSQIDKTPNALWKEKESITSTHINAIKSIRRLKSPKKTQESKKSMNDVKIEDVFLNSDYFKGHSGNKSSLSFCSGDNGENQWTVDSTFEMPSRRKSAKLASCPSDAIKSDTAFLEKEKISKHWEEKLKKQRCSTRENPGENSERFLGEILTGKERLDRDLITLITDQMFLAERELQITRTHLMETISKLNERDLEILQLHEKIQNLQKSRKMEKTTADKAVCEGPNKTSEDYQRLVKASEKLKKQVKDMEEFLNEYGLVWVGEKASCEKPDFDKIIKSFQRLNSVASQPKIIQTTVGAKFELPQEIPVVLYSNGLLLRNSEFREYNKALTSLFLQDVEDGYFPSELQAEFPDGVPFEVIDKRNEVYSPHAKTLTFQGQGNRLGSSFDGKSSVFLPQKHKIVNINSTRQDSVEKHAVKNLHKKKSRNVYVQDDKSLSTLLLGGTNPSVSIEDPRKEITVSKPQIIVKIRFGKEKTETFFMRVKENEKMYAFQVELQRRLCERYHDECIVNNETNDQITDFELHIYGRNPVRLSEHLNEYPKECGIVNNCLINVTEI